MGHFTHHDPVILQNLSDFKINKFGNIDSLPRVPANRVGEASLAILLCHRGKEELFAGKSHAYTYREALPHTWMSN